MAKLSNNELLSKILEELDSILASQNKTAKTDGGGLPNSLALDKPKGKGASVATAMGGSIASLGESISNLSKVSDADVEHIASIIQSIGSAIANIQATPEDIKSLNSLANSLKSINEIFGGMTDNLFLTLKKFNPVKGKMLGKAMGKFYANIFKGFSEAKVWDYLPAASKKLMEAFKAVMQTMVNIFQISGKLILSMAIALKKLDQKAADNFSGFIVTIIKTINDVPSDKKFGKQLNNFSTLVQILAQCAQHIISLTLLSILGLTVGKGLKNFIEAIILPFINISPKLMRQVVRVAKAFRLLLLTLVAALLVTILIAAIAPPKLIAEGIAILGVMVLFTLILIKTLSSKSIRSESKHAILAAAAFAILLFTLTLSLAICVYMAELADWKQVFKGIAMLAFIVLFTIAAVYVLSKKSILKGTKEALWTVLGFGLLLLIITAVSFAFIKLGEYAGEILKGGVVVFLFVAISVGLVYALSLIPEEKLASGLMTSLMVAGAIVVLTIAAGLFTILAKKVIELGLDNVAIASLIIFGIIGVVTGVAIGLGALLESPAGVFLIGGIAALALISLSILALSVSITQFVKLVNLINESLTLDKITTATKMIVGGEDSSGSFVSAISQIIDGLYLIGLKKAAKVAAISILLLPLFFTIGRFVDIIQKMANMEMLDKINPDGTRVYKKMDPDSFKNASNALATGFADFISILATTFKEKSDAMQNLALVLLALFPTEGIFLKRPSFKRLVDSLGKFIDVIQKLASTAIPTGFDNDGKPTGYTKFTENTFTEASTILAKGFYNFIGIIAEGFGGEEAMNNLKFILEALFPTEGIFRKKPSFGRLMDSLSTFVDMIIKLTTLMIPDKWGEDGTPTHYKHVDIEKEVVPAAQVLTNAFIEFLTTFLKGMSNVNENAGKAVKMLSKSGIDVLMNGVAAFMEPIIKLASGKIALNDKIIDFDKTKCAEGAGIIMQCIQELLTPMEGIYNLANKKHIKIISDSMETITNMCTNTVGTVMGENPSKFSEACTLMTSGIGTIYDYVNNAERNYELLKTNSTTLSEAIKMLTSISIAENYLSAEGLVTAFGKIDKLLNKEGTKRIEKLNNTSKAFDGVAKSVKELNLALDNLIKTEKNWAKLNNDSLYKKWKDMIEKLTKSLKDAAEEYTKSASTLVEGLKNITDSSTVSINLTEATITALSSATGSATVNNMKSLELNTTNSGKKYTVD